MTLAGAGVAAWGIWAQPPSPTDASGPHGDPPAPEPTPVPAWFVDREERRRAEEAVCQSGSTVGITTSLWGAGGFGKTTLAEMVCASPRVRKRYKGGVYRFTIGREVRGRADITARVAEITRFITGDTAQFTDPADAGRHLGRLLDQRKPTLLLLDDVWTAEQLDPFLHGGSQCLRLVTTRVPALLPAGARMIQVDQMTLDQARTVLTWEVDGLPPLTTGALLNATGRWPLLLRLVNRQLKTHIATGQDPAQAAEEMLQRLRVHGPQGVDPAGGAVDVDRPEDRRRAIRATVEAATGLLPEDGTERFAELAIFAEDEAIPLPLIARLWRATAGLSEHRSRELCAELAGLSLLSLSTDNGGRITLHDVIRDYLFSTRQPAQLAALHDQLVDASAEDLPEAAPLSATHTGSPYRAWWELADGYLQDHLIEHLVAAGRTELAEAVAGDLRWVEERLVRHGANAAPRDLSHVPTTHAASRARTLAQSTHLLAPTDPASLVLSTLYSRLAFSPLWRDQVTARLASAPTRPLLVALWPPPDLPDPALLTTLTGHSDSVMSVAISPDGTWLATGSGDMTVRLWDRATGRCTATLTGHSDSVMSVAISPDGTWLATGSGDMTVRLWDRATGRCTATLTGHSDSVMSVAISPDGTWLATGSGDMTVRLWDRATGRCTATLTGHSDSVMSVAISPDGTWLATGSGDKAVRLWDRATGRCTATLTGHSDSVESVAISPDGTWLVTTSRDETVRLWDRATGRCTATFTGHRSAVHSVAISPGGAWLATTSQYMTVRLWDRATGRCTATFTGHRSAVHSVAISPDGAWLATTSHDKTVRLWDRTTSRCTTTLTGHTDDVTSVAISPDGAWLATTSHDKTVRLWDRAMGRCTATLTGHTDDVTSVAISPDGAWLATTSRDRTVRLWDREGTLSRAGDRAANSSAPTQADELRDAGDPDGSARLWETRGGRSAIQRAGSHSAANSVAISPDGTWLATASSGRRARLWDRATGRCTATLTGHTDDVTSVAISPDGAWLATTSRDRTVRLWDRAMGRCTATLTGHTDDVTSVAISPDGAWLATASWDRTVRLWDRTTSRCTATLTGHTGRVESVAISPDGAWLATASWDRTVRLWDRAMGRCTATLTGHTGRVESVAISPDGAWLATASWDRTVRLWDRAMGRCTATLTGHTGRVESVAISPDGAWLATASQSGEAHVWNVHEGRTATLVRVDGELTTCTWTLQGQALFAAGSCGLNAFELRT
ncbi:hypothetical protein DVA86_27185 [Streptomyces armeniacus]|uniref:NB-ARC domain-containing protein n=1 Tax=Streptomyces armeniacus TaxID=83291 RepID=A0A345Y1C4_9ACTN|nr:hypothetical protein DVA86_27185 [Streptomyces armeniacus]